MSTPPILAECDRLIAAPVDVVWDLVSTAAGLERWMAVEATLELRPGGTIRWIHDNGWIVAGRIVDVAPPRRLRFTYGWEKGGFPVPVGSTVVTIELDALGPSTRVRITHAGLDRPMADRHTLGWARFVDRLASAAEPPGQIP